MIQRRNDLDLSFLIQLNMPLEQAFSTHFKKPEKQTNGERKS